MTDKRLVTDEGATRIERWVGYVPATSDYLRHEVEDIQALLDTRERCIEVLERLAARSRSFGYSPCLG